MAILALLTGVWVILNKPLSTITNVSALQRNLGTKLKKELLMAILAMLTRVWVTLSKLLSTTTNTLALLEK